MLAAWTAAQGTLPWLILLQSRTNYPTFGVPDQVLIWVFRSEMSEKLTNRRNWLAFHGRVEGPIPLEYQIKVQIGFSGPKCRKVNQPATLAGISGAGGGSDSASHTGRVKERNRDKSCPSATSTPGPLRPWPSFLAWGLARRRFFARIGFCHHGLYPFQLRVPSPSFTAGRRGVP